MQLILTHRYATKDQNVLSYSLSSPSQLKIGQKSLGTVTDYQRLPLTGSEACFYTGLEASNLCGLDGMDGMGMG